MIIKTATTIAPTVRIRPLSRQFLRSCSEHAPSTLRARSEHNSRERSRGALVESRRRQAHGTAGLPADGGGGGIGGGAAHEPGGDGAGRRPRERADRAG